MTLSTILTTWSLEPLVVIPLLLSILLYLRGVVYTSQRGIGPHLQWWQIVCFFLGLLTIFIALESIIDSAATQLLWVHMIQHDLLIMVAPPLLLLGIPSWIIWRAVPASWRRGILLVAIRFRWPWRTGQVIGHIASQPSVVWLVFVGDLLFWHIPFFYNATLYNSTIHIMEHLFFLGTALLLWGQLIPSHPQRRVAKTATQVAPLKGEAGRLSYPQQALYMASIALVMNVLGAVYVFSTGPIYQYYAALARTPDMPSVVVDQHYAGVVMDVPGTLIFFGTMMILVGLWLQDDERAAEAEATEASVVLKR